MAPSARGEIFAAPTKEGAWDDMRCQEPPWHSTVDGLNQPKLFKAAPCSRERLTLRPGDPVGGITASNRDRSTAPAAFRERWR